MRATACLAVGIFLVFTGHPILGIFAELFGLLNIFGNMFPFLMVFLKQLPLIGPIVKQTTSGSSSKSKKKKAAQRQDDYNYDYDDYGGTGESGRSGYDYDYYGDQKPPSQNYYSGEEDDYRDYNNKGGYYGR